MGQPLTTNFPRSPLLCTATQVTDNLSQAGTVRALEAPARRTSGGLFVLRRPPPRCPVARKIIVKYEDHHDGVR
jgi:hypothetical protein